MTIDRVSRQRNILDPIFELRAVRKYQDRPIASADMDLVLRAATMACSSGNTQPWEFVVVEGKEQKQTIKSWMSQGWEESDARRSQTAEELVDGAGRSVTGHASVESLDVVPAVIFVFWNPDRGIRFRDEYLENPDGTLRMTGSVPNNPRGASIYPACQNMMLAAQALGIGSIFTTRACKFAEPIKTLLGVPPRMFLEAAIYLGYKNEKLGPPRRRPLTEVAHIGHWENRYVYDPTAP